MASPFVWPAALAPLGPDILALAGNYFSGNIYWVDSATGSDSNAGTEPELPHATWTHAQATASANDMILVASGHQETVSVANTLSTVGVTTIGMGLGTLRPRFTSSVAGVMWTASGANQRFFNCYFKASTDATTARIAITGADVTLFGSYFENGTNDTANCVTVSANNARIESCDFVSTASRPARGVNVTGAVTGVALKDVLFDGGSFGWSSHAFDVTAAATRLKFEDVRLANRSDFYITNTGTSYQGFGVRAIDSANCRIVLTA